MSQSTRRQVAEKIDSIEKDKSLPFTEILDALSADKTAMWELTERGVRTYVRTFPGPAEPAGLTDVIWWPIPTRSHLCLTRDHISSYWSIRGAISR